MMTSTEDAIFLSMKSQSKRRRRSDKYGDAIVENVRNRALFMNILCTFHFVKIEACGVNVFHEWLKNLRRNV